MKKFINDPSMVEEQMILGMVKAHPQHLCKLDCGNVVVRAVQKEGKVAIISGGGSGHEPAHGGYVGTGMLDAAVAGAEHTKDLVATKGRASYVGERGLGHQDPGATSYAYLLETIAHCIQEG